MEISFSRQCSSIGDMEVVERKGVGHPDSIADLIAEDFSNRYSRYCLQNYGAVFNHWFDKVTISGGVCDLGFGKLAVKKPVTVYLFGRVTSSFGEVIIPYEDLFKESCSSIFYGIFGSGFPQENIKTFVDVNTALGADHDKSFYFPTPENKLVLKEAFVANDSVVCTGFAPYTKAEKLSILIENYLNSGTFKASHDYTGWDIKVIVLRKGSFYRITTCVPFIATKIESLHDYNQKKSLVEEDAKLFIKNTNLLSKEEQFEFYLNTKDYEDKGYLVAYGTAADKGDFGAVGRGNRYSGIISSQRGTNIEAVNGKNPMNHSGKLYTIIAHRIAWKLYKETGAPFEVTIMTDNGRSLNDPVFVHISSPDLEGLQKSHIIYIEKTFNEIGAMLNGIINTDVIDSFKNKECIAL